MVGAQGGRGNKCGWKAGGRYACPYSLYSGFSSSSKLNTSTLPDCPWGLQVQSSTICTFRPTDTLSCPRAGVLRCGSLVRAGGAPLSGEGRLEWCGEWHLQGETPLNSVLQGLLHLAWGDWGGGWGSGIRLPLLTSLCCVVALDILVATLSCCLYLQSPTLHCSGVDFQTIVVILVAPWHA